MKWHHFSLTNQLCPFSFLRNQIKPSLSSFLTPHLHRCSETALRNALLTPSTLSQTHSKLGIILNSNPLLDGCSAESLSLQAGVRHSCCVDLIDDKGQRYTGRNCASLWYKWNYIKGWHFFFFTLVNSSFEVVISFTMFLSTPKTAEL